MADQELELGLLHKPPSEIPEPYSGRVNDFAPIFPNSFGLAANNSSAGLHTERRQQENPPRDDSIIEVPRQQLEQLMKLWIEIFQKSLATRDTQNMQTATDISVGLPMTGEAVQATLQHCRDSESTMPNPATNFLATENAWRCIVQVMSKSEIQAENEQRRSVRDLWWPGTGNWACLGDSWRHLWEPMTEPGVRHVELFQFSHPEEKRKALQLDLIDALTAQSNLPVVNRMRKDFSSIAPWISLIGLRLNELRPMYRSSPQIDSVKQIEVLIECLWACNRYSPKLGVAQDRQGPNIGDVLISCYRRGVLCQSSIRSGIDQSLVSEHFELVCRALFLISTLYRLRLRSFRLGKAPGIRWDMLLSDAEASMRDPPRRTEVEMRQDAFCRIGDFNIKDLQTLGQLQLQWTSYWDEHLELEVKPEATVLKLYWFQPALAQFLVQNRLCTKIGFGERKQRENEISATWSMLFTFEREHKSRLCYGKLKAPRWMSLLAFSELGKPRWTNSSMTRWDPQKILFGSFDEGPELQQFMEKSKSSSRFCLDIQEHLTRRWPNVGKIKHERVLFSQFPIYGERLRELRAYMDSREPQGLRALWRDRRNSNTYFTFWFVAIFGGLSVFLATCALALSIAQTWASFHLRP